MTADRPALPKPYYDDGTCVIYHGDCRDVLPMLEPKVLVTDPPYGVNRKSFLDEWSEVSSLDRIGGNVVAAIFTGPTRVWDLAKVLPSWKFLRLLWMHKSADLAPPGLANRSGWFCNSEVIALAERGRAMWPTPVDYRTDLYQVGPWARTGTHPCEKPLTVVADVVRRITLAEDEVMDPFMGTGTTLRAAKDLGRRAIGIEISERYCEIAARRLGQEVFDFAKGDV